MDFMQQKSEQSDTEIERTDAPIIATEYSRKSVVSNNLFHLETHKEKPQEALEDSFLTANEEDKQDNTMNIPKSQSAALPFKGLSKMREEFASGKKEPEIVHDEVDESMSENAEDDNPYY